VEGSNRKKRLERIVQSKTMERLSRTKRSVIGVRVKRGMNVLAPKGKVV
jgi:hypothetical protein